MPCKPLPDVQGDDVDALVDWVVDVAGLYGECAARHRAIVKAWGSE